MKNLIKFLFLLISIHLVLPSNVFQSFDKDCPQQCVCLGATVNCANKKYTTFPDQLPSWCRLLLLQSNPIGSLKLANESKISAPDRLIEIDLSNSELVEIETDYFVQNFLNSNRINESLKVLILDDNRLSLIPKLNGLSNLRRLTLSNNQLKREELQTIDIQPFYPKLESLDLSTNSIQLISKNFLGFHGNATNSTSNLSLLSLNLQDNQIATIESGAFSLLGNLKRLDLSFNNLCRISVDLFAINVLNNLKQLDLSNNQIEQIDPKAFRWLRLLQTLKLRHNRLFNLMDQTFQGLTSLQKLYLDHNWIGDIRQGWTFGMKSLSQLSIRNNSIATIEQECWDSIPKLADLNLSHNRLQIVNVRTFSRLRMLQVLVIANNNLSQIEPDSFRELTSLTVLDISGNFYSWSSNKSQSGYWIVSREDSVKMTPVVPYFVVRPPSNQTVEVATTAKLECFVKGEPTPIVRWNKIEGDFVAAKERRLILMPDNQVVLIAEVTPADMGQYQCTASNQFGSISATTYLTTFKSPSLLHQKQSSIVALYDSTVDIDCATIGYPPPRVVWLKNGRRLMVKDPRSTYSSNGQILTINHLKYFDSGNYSCNISNSYGHLFVSSILTIVESKPPFEFNISIQQQELPKNTKISEDLLKTRSDNYLSSVINWFQNVSSSTNSLLSNQQNKLLVIVAIVDLFVLLTLISWIWAFCYIRKQDRIRMKKLGENEKRYNKEKTIPKQSKSPINDKNNNNKIFQLDSSTSLSSSFDLETDF